MKDLYLDAVFKGTAEYGRQNPAVVRPEIQPIFGPKGVGYWIARHAAREATGALLEEARRVGVTEQQWEALRAVAADVAYD